jgi:hypothetical protein
MPAIAAGDMDAQLQRVLQGFPNAEKVRSFLAHALQEAKDGGEAEADGAPMATHWHMPPKPLVRRGTGTCVTPPPLAPAP